MARQERMSGGRKCPRGCGNNVHPTHPPVSKKDSKQVCTDCFVDELLGWKR